MGLAQDLDPAQDMDLGHDLDLGLGPVEEGEDGVLGGMRVVAEVEAGLGRAVMAVTKERVRLAFLPELICRPTEGTRTPGVESGVPGRARIATMQQTKVKTMAQRITLPRWMPMRPRCRRSQLLRRTAIALVDKNRATMMMPLRLLLERSSFLLVAGQRATTLPRSRGAMRGALRPLQSDLRSGEEPPPGSAIESQSEVRGAIEAGVLPKAGAEVRFAGSLAGAAMTVGIVTAMATRTEGEAVKVRSEVPSETENAAPRGEGAPIVTESEPPLHHVRIVATTGVAATGTGAPQQIAAVARYLESPLKRLLSMAPYQQRKKIGRDLPMTRTEHEERVNPDPDLQVAGQKLRALGMGCERQMSKQARPAPPCQLTLRR
jgi:hypothetical protein